MTHQRENRIQNNPESMLERVNRWARMLPTEEVIPIGSEERYEFAELMANRMNPALGKTTQKEILASLKAGTAHYGGHKVVVL